MTLSVAEMCLIAGELAEEHGRRARDYARRESLQWQAEGDSESALFWYSLSVLVDDVVTHRLSPDHVPTIQ